MKNQIKYRYATRRSFLAKYDSVCPYCNCEILANQDWIVKGKLGYGHNECINLKMHFNEMGSPICGTEWKPHTRTTLDWDKVNCKKCLKKR